MQKIQKELFVVFLARWTRWAARHALLIVLLLLIFAAACAYYAKSHLGVNSSTSEMFDETLPFRQAQSAYNEAFPVLDDRFFMVIQGEDFQQADTAARELILALNERDHLFENVYLAGADTFYEEHQLLYMDLDELLALSDALVEAQLFLGSLARDFTLRGFFQIFTAIVDGTAPNNQLLTESFWIGLSQSIEAASMMNAQAMDWSYLGNNASSSSGPSLRILHIKPILDYSKLLPAKPAILEARNLRYAIEAAYPVSVRISGKKALAFEEMQSVTTGAARAGLLALACVGLILWLGLRSPKLIIVTVLSLLIGLLITAAFAAFAIGQLNMISVAFAVLYIGLGVDYPIHLSLRYRELRQRGEKAEDALSATVNDIGPSLVLCTLSTACGFFAFIPTSFSGVSELGMIAGVGMFISLFVSLAFFPAWMTLFPVTRVKDRALSHTFALFLRYLLEVPVRHYSWVKFSIVIVVLLALFALPKTRFDYDPLNLRDAQSESVSTMRGLLQGGHIRQWTVSALANGLDDARETALQMEAVDGIARVITIEDMLPADVAQKLEIIDELSLAMFGALQISEPPPSTHLQSESSLLKFENALLEGNAVEPSIKEALKNSLEHFSNSTEAEKFGQLSENILQPLRDLLADLSVAMDVSAPSLSDLPQDTRERWVSPNGDYRILAIPDKDLKGVGDMRHLAYAIQDQVPSATGDLIVTLSSGDAVVSAFREAITYAIIAAIVLVFVFLRSWRETLLILIPLLFAGAMTISIGVLLESPFNFANIIALPLLLGLGVDNGIHIVHRARKGLTANECLTASSTTRAIVLSAMTTLFSFGNLVFSPHPGTASMGLMLTIGLFCMLYATLWVLPTFLQKPKV